MSRSPDTPIAWLAPALAAVVMPAFQATARIQDGHATLECLDCHDTHFTSNLSLIREVIDTPGSGLLPVLFLDIQGPNSFADGDMVYDGVCEVCHTQTDHHRNNPTGNHDHFAGMDCTACHVHSEGFLPVVVDHPQAVTDCSNCHADHATGEPDLLGVHGFDCQLCHTDGFDSTFLGPLGTWQGECAECHNPGVPETGNAPVPDNEHRCAVCHGVGSTAAKRGRPDAGGPLGLSAANAPVVLIDAAIHRGHADRSNCVVCHGFTPDVGTEVGSGNRAICAVCHAPGQHDGTPHMEFHRAHVSKGLSCLECHGDERPPVDVVDGPLVGNATNVCQVCHVNRSPGEFSGNSDELHREHAGERIDCGSCHLDANLQDDRDPMPDVDDLVRAMVDRAGYGECSHCHGDSVSGDPMSIHRSHVRDQWQWCHNCHEGDDLRPPGAAPPVTQPSESCILCHSDRSYVPGQVFAVHRDHAEKAKCYACHQLTPPLLDWPLSWLGGGAPNDASSLSIAP